jgi:hypothetical protein
MSLGKQFSGTILDQRGGPWRAVSILTGEVVSVQTVSKLTWALFHAK